MQTPQRLADVALVVLEHQRRLDHVDQRAHLRVSKHGLEQREKTRSAAAEFGVHEPTVRIASAHVRINFSEISVKFACQI